MIGWAIFQYDRTLHEDRLVAMYMNPVDANADALTMSNADIQPSVQPFEVHEEAQYQSTGPVTADDFTTVIHVAGEINPLP